jgi:hypothetical protein
VEDLFQETVPEAIDGILNSFNLDKIHAQSEEAFGIHVFAIAWRKSRTLWANPTFRA